MQKTKESVDIEVIMDGSPLLQARLCEGLVRFGQSHPRWRFSMHGTNFRYSRIWLKEHQVDGVLLNLNNPKPVTRKLDAAGVPWVHLLPLKPVPYPHVAIDHQALGRIGAEYFLNKGLFRCVFFGGEHSPHEIRAASFRQRMAEAGRDCEIISIPFSTYPFWEFSSDSEKLLHKYVANLERGMAVMCSHDLLANRLIAAALQQGLKVPQDLIVLGTGNHDFLCKLSPVEISSINTSIPRVSIHGAAMLEAMIAGEKDPDSITISPGGVVERQSTEVMDYGDDLVVKIMAYIRENVCNKLKVEELLEAFPVSRATLSRRFEKYIGHSPATEIRQCRMRMAQQLLRESDMSLSEIAFTCGYADLSHMDKDFKSLCKTTPGTMRKI